MRALPKPWSASPICSEILWMGLLQNRAFCQGTAKSAARHVSNTTCAVEWYHGLASPYGRGGRAQLGRRGSTLRIQWTFARPSQSRLRRASSPRGRAKVAFSIAPERTELLPMKNGKVPPLCHSDGRASGVEESTTLDNEPPQDKPSYLGRFLDSLRSLGMTCTTGSTSAPIVSTTYNAAPPLIHRLRAVPLPRWGRSFWSFPGAFPTSFNGRTEMTNVGPPNNCPLSIWT